MMTAIKTDRNDTARLPYHKWAVAEWRFGQTIGKHVFGLHVVRESGARISFGQSVVRQLPQLLQVFWIDVMFALFTERKQRAFELLSQTRVVVTAPDESTAIRPSASPVVR